MGDKAKLAGLQTEEQRLILDAITQIRKCGLEGVLELPQIVVCGDQSSGKSSVMEALTGIPFARHDNLCTRFATEISLRHEAEYKLTVKVIPDSDRSSDEQERMAHFSESITDLAALPAVMDAAKEVMGFNTEGGNGRAFAKDTLSVVVEGPGQPHVTLVDIPGLISTASKGVTEADIASVAQITEHYISQSRTICLAVIQATNDFDPDVGSDTEAKFLELARNEDVVFKLGWHVVKNRTFKERHHTLEERNASEREFFEGSVFGQLPKASRGIDTLRLRLSRLLLEHVKAELPHLRGEAESALQGAKSEMSLLGSSRGTIEECRSYLVHLSMACYEICKAGVQGHYEDGFFRVQEENQKFSERLRNYGHKYIFGQNEPLFESASEESASEEAPAPSKVLPPGQEHSVILERKHARNWVHKLLMRSRGRELIGNYNPHLLNELFWEQSERWQKLASEHVDTVYHRCEVFMSKLLSQKAPPEVKDKVLNAACEELEKLTHDNNGFLQNYNHYYTEDLQKRRNSLMKTQLKGQFGDIVTSRRATVPETTIIQRVLDLSQPKTTKDMELFSCDEALDHLQSIYKVQPKVFVANVPVQVIERHLVRGLETIFSPAKIVLLPDDVVREIATESPSTGERRRLIRDRMEKLQAGLRILRTVAAPSPFPSEI
ncbi:interferon-induced GTP-binding protein Mx [Xylariaceae sp. FL0594]|nr:interferon-induced GTP-binding protein Mx [Xylariaceae sp. FL0594]